MLRKNSIKRIALFTCREKHPDPLQNFFQHAAISLGPLYLEAYLHEYGPQVEVAIVDSLDEALAARPDLVGISAATQNFSQATRDARQIKAVLGVPVVVGGSHITALPKSLPPGIDVGVIGEGEETFRQLVLCLSQERWNSEIFKSIDGIVFHGEKGPFVTGFRKPIMPIDRIPRPRRVAWAKDLGIAHLVSARGCPFSCSFCTESESVSRYRVFSIPAIVDEVKELVLHFNAKSIRFFDDVFNINLKRIRSLGEALRAEGLTDEVLFSAWGRASTMTPEMVEAMQSMNMGHLAFGFETGSDHVLSLIKTGTTVAQNQRAIDLCNDAGIMVSGTFLIGVPGERSEDLDATLTFIEKNKQALIDLEINPIIPLPGAALWLAAVKRGLVSESMEDWGILRDQAYLPAFDMNRYIYLNETMPKAEFADYIAKFAKLYVQFMQEPRTLETGKKLFPDLRPARLKKKERVPEALVA